MNKNLKKFKKEWETILDIHGYVFELESIRTLLRIKSSVRYGDDGFKTEDTYTGFRISLGEGAGVSIVEDDETSAQDVRDAYDFIYNEMTTGEV